MAQENKRYTSIKTKDIAEIMEVIQKSRLLSPVAYKRLHYYIVSLEHMLEEALQTVCLDNSKLDAKEYISRHN